MNKNLFTIIDFKWVFSFMKMNFEEDYNENQIPKSAKITSEMPLLIVQRSLYILNLFLETACFK